MLVLRYENILNLIQHCIFMSSATATKLAHSKMRSNWFLKKKDISVMRRFSSGYQGFIKLLKVYITGPKGYNIVTVHKIRFCLLEG